MPRLMGVDIPNDKQIQYSLTYLYGIGLHSAREACEKLGIDPIRPASDIHEDELGRIAAIFHSHSPSMGLRRMSLAWQSLPRAGRYQAPEPRWR